MTFRGVSAGREVAPETLVVDVGGGSTELILGGPEGVSMHESLDLGCVRLTERFGADFDACAGHVRESLTARVPASIRPRHAIGVAGTITTLATLDLGLAEEDPEIVHGHALASATIAEQTARLAGMSVEEIRALRGMHPDRAPVIAAGAVVVSETLSYFELPELEVSEHDIMHGAALAAAELPEKPQPGAPRAGLCGSLNPLRGLGTRAAGVGFEPTGRLRAQRFSRPPDSTALAPRQKASLVGEAWPKTARRQSRANFAACGLGELSRSLKCAGGEGQRVGRLADSLLPAAS